MTTSTIQKWICESCGFIYDPADGDPDVAHPHGRRVVVEPPQPPRGAREVRALELAHRSQEERHGGRSLG